EDSGSGIDQENVDRIFGAFFTTKVDGLGMGLSSAKFSSMNGYGSQCSIQATTLRTTQAAKMMDCVMIKLQEPIVAATVSAIRWPGVSCDLYAACQFLCFVAIGAGLRPNQQ